jgi:hypothetical protein
MICLYFMSEYVWRDHYRVNFKSQVKTPLLARASSLTLLPPLLPLLAVQRTMATVAMLPPSANGALMAPGTGKIKSKNQLRRAKAKQKKAVDGVRARVEVGDAHSLTRGAFALRRPRAMSSRNRRRH